MPGSLSRVHPDVAKGRMPQWAPPGNEWDTNLVSSDPHRSKLHVVLISGDTEHELSPDETRLVINRFGAVSRPAARLPLWMVGPCRLSVSDPTLIAEIERYLAEQPEPKTN
jgi:hypothetical protein